GIRSGKDAVAYKKIIIEPEPVGDIDFVKASYKSVYGLISSEWHKKENNFELDITIPANTSATVYLPFNSGSTVLMNGVKLKVVNLQNGKAVINTGSGAYHFEVISNN
ncbi:MAG: alpha-L-rhamnosidase, partial [Bacteroidetes bacterium]|nr:alpha-L-rhamnosidase [Bacteroidota bacterium]